MVAHYLRPTVRDAHGHTQRLGPAVLATWDALRDGFEDFGWGILPELAFRVGAKAGDLEQDIEQRRDLLRSLALDGLTDPSDVRTALHGYLATSA